MNEDEIKALDLYEAEHKVGEWLLSDDDYVDKDDDDDDREWMRASNLRFHRS